MNEQSYSNHGRILPLFHYVALPILALNFLWACYRLWTSHFSADGFAGVILAVGLLASLFCARLFALTVQDRVIRLEERMRFARLLPDDLKPRIQEFSVSQLVSLRFASDAELPALARKVLAENLRDRKQIKRLVRNWKPDYLRA
ncbi:MAG TPA: DUF6526 family protein [Candidatus Dormibacteraeota bacterium]|jgi:hypothetical protein|nr:DUF6526 family protein [Candidatus Dormibacteraeota bacterium]